MKTPNTSLRHRTWLGRFHEDVRGLSTVEYVIILVIIAVTAIVTWKNFGETLRGKIKQSEDDIGNLGTK